MDERADDTIYVGTRGPAGPRVEIEENGSRSPLWGPRRHPSMGLEWGYRGFGPANTARSILWHALGRELSMQQYRHFTWEIVARLPRGGFRLEGREVRAWARRRLG